MPDIVYTSRERLPGGKVPKGRVWKVVPDLVVEILSDSNRPGEMRRKREVYFTAGVRLVWEIDPETKTAHVYTNVDESTHIPADGALDGGDVLPGFRVPLAELFAMVEGDHLGGEPNDAADV